MQRTGFSFQKIREITGLTVMVSILVTFPFRYRLLSLLPLLSKSAVPLVVGWVKKPLGPLFFVRPKNRETGTAVAQNAEAMQIEPDVSVTPINGPPVPWLVERGKITHLKTLKLHFYQTILRGELTYRQCNVNPRSPDFLKPIWKPQVRRHILELLGHRFCPGWRNVPRFDW
jgi:hypothetical protein